MDYWSVEVMYYDDGHQELNTYEGGAEAIVRILDVVDCSELESLKGKYIRAAIKRGESLKIIGNIIKDQWFDCGSFFDDKEKEKAG